MRLRVIDTVEEFIAIESAWETLRKHSKSTVFQSYSINAEAYMHLLYHKTLQLVLLEEGQSLKAIFPCYLDACKTLRFINDDQGSSMIMKDHQWLSMIINAYQGLSMIINDYQGLSRFINDDQGLSWIINDFQ